MHVFAIRSQNGHACHFVMPSRAWVVLLITFTPEPPSTMLPGISWPWMITLIVSLCSSIIVGPLTGLMKLTSTYSNVFLVRIVATVFVNRGTNLSNLDNGKVIWQSASTCHVELCLVVDSVTSFFLPVTGIISTISLLSCIIQSVFYLFACSTHSYMAFWIGSWVSHSDCFALLLVVTSCISAVTIFTVGAFPFSFVGHWFA